MTDAEDRWQTDPFDDGSSRLVGERQLEYMKEFEDGHVLEMQGLWQASLSAISKSDSTSKYRTGNIKDPIGLWFQPYEQANPLDLVKTDNKLFNKLTQTFAALMNEMELLSEEGGAKFFAPLALFGQLVTDEDRQEAGELREGSPTQPKVPGDTEEAAEGEAQEWMGRMWPLMISLAQFVHRSYAVISNTIRQLGALYLQSSRLYQQSYQHVHLSPVFHKMFKLLTVLMTLDEIIANNEQITTCWGMYKRMVKTISKDPPKYNVEKDALWKFEKLMFDIHGLLMDGHIFRNCIEQEFDLVNQGTLGAGNGPEYPPFKIEVRNNAALAKEFYYQLRQMEEFLAYEAQSAASTVTSYGGAGFAASALTPGQSSQTPGPTLTNTIFSDESSVGTSGGRTYLGSCILFALWFNIWRVQDESSRKLFKSLFEHAKKVPVVQLYGSAVFDGPSMLAKYAGPLVTLSKLNNPQAISHSLKTQYLTSLNNDLAAKTKILFASISRWMVRMESSKPTENELTAPTTAQPQTNGTDHPSRGSQEVFVSLVMLAQGLKLASAASQTAKHFLSLHTSLRAPLKSVNIPVLFELLHLIKSIQGTMIRHRGWISRLFFLHYNETTETLTRTMASVQTTLLKAKLNDAQLDQLAACTLALSMLQSGPPTAGRLVLLILSLAQSGISEFYQPAELKAIQSLVARMAFICRFNRDLRDACDTSFIYWFADDLFPIYLKALYQSPQDAHKLPYTFQVLGSDIPYVLLQQSIHESPSVLLAAFRRQMWHALRDNVVHPLCNEIEKDLRLHRHSQSEGAINQIDPFKNGVHDVLPFLLLPPLQLHTFDLDIKTYVQHFLDTNFYNVNTVVLFDWQNYSEMRNLAYLKYGLDMQPVHLPGQTQDQGVDILIIMRKIHVFTSGYNYNLNNQIFVQKSSDDNKTLNTINIQHIANSIRTHGTGIMNTTVNYTYLYLRQKFGVFSQFLFDEQIKASLFREIRFFTENKEKLDSKYPYDHAEKIIRDIRKLGNLQDGMSYLDKFRILITEIGNAMGYVRMIRSGGLLHTSNAIKFVPDLENVSKFAPLFQAAGAPEDEKPAHISHETWDAAKNLDNIIGNLTHNFAEGTNYFKMFVSVFQAQFGSAANLHLKNFYIIVPALTVSFVESMLSAKEKMNKFKKGNKGTMEGQFTDDGFAIGVAYILRLLDQDREFESLHWFQSVLAKLAADEKESQAAEAAKKSDDPTSLSRLTLKKVAALHAEYSLLRFSLTGARVFFSETGKEYKK